VKCSLEEAERRDPKGLYAAARAGNIDQFTGVNHPFQEPHNPDVVVNSETSSIKEGVEIVISKLLGFDYIKGGANPQVESHIQKNNTQIIETLERLGHI
jgi:adenylylsulfate kinase